jgi:integrase
VGGVIGTVPKPMPRAATGTVETHEWADGRTVTYRLRVRSDGKRHRINLGTNHEGWNQTRAEVELERISQQIARGTWEPPCDEKPKPGAVTASQDETFHVTASRWWKRRRLELSDKGREDYEWRLGHLLMYFKDIETAVIGPELIDDYRASKLGEREFVDGGGKLPGKRKPLGPRSINMTLGVLAQILDDAVKYGLLETNPAKGPGTRVKQKKKRGNVLEPDMVVDVIEAAEAWEREEHMTAYQRYGRGALLALMCTGGPRIDEATSYTRGSLDLHAGILRGGNKTAAGEHRILELSWFLVGKLRGHVALEPDVAPGVWLFHTNTGKRLNPNNIRNRLLKGIQGNERADGTRHRIRGVVERVNEKRAAEGRLLLPDNPTPHTFRRTFAYMSALAGRDPRFVMNQIGHDDARLTLEVYDMGANRRNADRDLAWELMRFREEVETPPGRRERAAVTERSGT